jgi:hypothetical protein
VEALVYVLQAQSCWDEPGGFVKALTMAERFGICSYERGDLNRQCAKSIEGVIRLMGVKRVNELLASKTAADVLGR